MYVCGVMCYVLCEGMRKPYIQISSFGNAQLHKNIFFFKWEISCLSDFLFFKMAGMVFKCIPK